MVLSLPSEAKDARAGFDAAPSTTEAEAVSHVCPPSRLHDCMNPGPALRTTEISVVLLTTSIAASGHMRFVARPGMSLSTVHVDPPSADRSVKAPVLVSHPQSHGNSHAPSTGDTTTLLIGYMSPRPWTVRTLSITRGVDHWVKPDEASVVLLWRSVGVFPGPSDQKTHSLLVLGARNKVGSHWAKPWEGWS